MTSEAATMREGKELINASRPYQQETRWLSWFHLLSGYALLGGGMAAAVVGPHWAVQAAGVLLSALMMLKLFIVYHDYMHRAMLKKSAVAKALMHLFGYFILAPPSIWKRTHDFHHAHTAKLAGSQVGSFPTLSTLMYERLPENKQRAYRIARNPLVILLGLVTVFIIGMCVSPLLKKPKENRQAAYALLFYAAIAAAMIYYLGVMAWLLAVIIPHAIAALIGSYLFYAQHNFPHIEIRSRHDWEYTHAAITASSFCKMGAVMNWFSGNIGYHHVHHLNSAIPFYNLPAAMEEIPELRNPVETTLKPSDIIACLKLKLWDPKRGEMVPFE